MLIALPFILLLIDYQVKIIAGISLIFVLMRVYSAYIYKADYNLNTLIYIFYVPELITGPIRPYNKWKGYILANNFKISDLIQILIMIILILLTGIVCDAVLNSSDQKIIRAIIIYLSLYAQFGAVTEMSNIVSSAIGLPKISNFNRPLLATSISDFWSRWHISLGEFAKHSINQPITFKLSKMKFARKYAYQISTMVTFAYIGIWHNLSVEYFMFGIYFGVVIVAERALRTVLQWRSEKIPIKIQNSLFIVYVQVVHIGGFMFVSEIVKKALILPVS